MRASTLPMAPASAIGAFGCSMVLVSLVSCAGAPVDGSSVAFERVADEPSVEGGLNIMLGRRETTGHLGDAGIHQLVLSFEGSLAPPDSMLGVEAGLSLGYGWENTDSWFVADGLESGIFEAYLGPRLTFDLSESVAFYLGAGLSYMDVSAEISQGSFLGFTGSERQSDSTWAGYGHVGLEGRVSRRARLVADLRFAGEAAVELFDQQVEVGYWQFSLGAGVTF